MPRFTIRMEGDNIGGKVVPASRISLYPKKKSFSIVTLATTGTESDLLTTITIINPKDTAWSSVLDETCPLRDAAAKETFFPRHFLQVVLPKIGGKLALVQHAGRPIALGLLFPRKVSAAPASMGGEVIGAAKLYTLRLCRLGESFESTESQLAQLINEALGDEERAILYQVGIRNSFRESAQEIGTLDNLPLTLGRPNKDESTRVRALHKQIWQGASDSLYPVDIHSREFGLATDLIARVGDEVAAFLMGFYKDGGSPLPAGWWEVHNGERRIESQVMGVLPQFRGQHLGYLLKRAQGEAALRDGIQIVNWTVDPLQFPNAVLNLGKLGAVAFGFYPDLYPFRNDLNRVPASRFEVTWLVGSERVRSRPLNARQRAFVDVDAERIPVLNDGYSESIRDADDCRVAIEIPRDWTAIQRDDLALAQRWRATTDTLFQKYIGLEDGQYTIVGVGKGGSSCYLIAERSTKALWTQLY